MIQMDYFDELKKVTNIDNIEGFDVIDCDVNMRIVNIECYDQHGNIFMEIRPKNLRYGMEQKT
jgi:hypothetical protein